MTIVSKTIELDPSKKIDIQPNQAGMRVTSVAAENDIGIKFVNEQGEETNIMVAGEVNLNTNILIDEDNYITLESTHSNDARTAFLSMEVA